MTLSVRPFPDDFAQQAHAAGAGRCLRNGVHDRDVVAVNLASQLDKGVSAHGSGVALSWVDVRPQLVPVDPGGPLHIEHALGGDPLPPLGNCLRCDAYGMCQLSPGTNGRGGDINRVGHIAGIYQRLTYVNRQFLEAHTCNVNNQPMVERNSPLRFEPAKRPSKFENFTDWLMDTITIPGSPRSGLANRLAEYIADELDDKTSAAHVSRWVKKSSIPEIPRLRLIAAWAQVEYEELKALVDSQVEARQKEARQGPPGRRAGGRPAKKSLRRAG